MPKLYTIGHSTHSLEEFIEILHGHAITHLVDVRTVPKSSHFPWFNQNDLKKSLPRNKIIYTHIPKLGGFRHSNKNSINQGWININFRNFADYMQTTEFFEGLKELNLLIKKHHRVVIMCAEALPWRCHRSLIADAELVRHFDVFHIMSKTSKKSHELTDFAVIDRKKDLFKFTIQNKVKVHGQ